MAEQREELADIADAVGNLGVIFAQQCIHEEAAAKFVEAREMYESLNAATEVKRIDMLFDRMKSCPKYQCEQCMALNSGQLHRTLMSVMSISRRGLKKGKVSLG